MKKTINTIEQASKITQREIVRDHAGFCAIWWKTPTHDMRIQKLLNEDRLLVLGEVRPTGICGRSRPRMIWVEDPSESYLKTLRPKLETP
jgi:hypothetical protein